MALFLFAPHWITSGLGTLAPNVLFSVPIQEPVVALTLDDGPDPQTTKNILDVLEENNAQATFFLITDHVEGNEQLVEQIVKRGHELGNHSVKDEASIRLSSEEFEEKFLKADEILHHFTDVSWLRPGYGLFNQKMLAIVGSNGYQTALGSVHPLDPQIPWANFSAWYILQNVKPGSIIILHDRGDRGERTAAVLAEVLPELRRRGFQVVTLSQLTELGAKSG